MRFNPNGCSHGIAWDKLCVQCEDVMLRQELYSLTVDIERVTNTLKTLL